jgi:MFS family permease
LSSASVTGGLAILRQRDFTRYLCARFCTSLAVQMIIIAVGWQVYHLTGRVLDLGLIGLSQFLPFLCLSLFAGHAADLYDRRVIIGLCMLAFAICTALLLAFALRGISSAVPIFAVLALFGVARAFLLPASQSFLPNIVPMDSLGHAVAINSSTFQVASIAGPSAGGLLYALGEASHRASGGAVYVYGVAGALLIGALAMVLSVKRRLAAYDRPDLSGGNLLEGLRFTWRKKAVLGAISLDLFAVLFGGATALLPAFTKDVLHAGPDVFGYLRAAPGVGAVATALWLAVRPVTRRVGVYMFGGVAIFGIATVIFGLTRDFWTALIALALMGAGDMVSVYVRGLLVQLATPDEIRGRVSAVNSIGIGASNELGEFESGTTAAWFGLVPAIVVGGVVTLAVAALWAGVLFPMLWRLQSFEQLKDPKADGTSRREPPGAH